MCRSERGFTLVELMIVVLILGVLVTIAITSYTVSTSRARTIACKNNQRILTDAIPVYRVVNNGEEPAAVGDLQDFAADFSKVQFCTEDHRPLSLIATAGVVTCTYPGHGE